MKIEVSREQVISIFNSLASMQGIKNTKFSYAVLKNLAAFEKETRQIEKDAAPSKKFLEWDGKRHKLCVTFSQKDKEGKPVINNGNFVIANRPIFDKELDKLKFGYVSAIKEHEAKMAQLRDTLSGVKCKVDVHAFLERELPEDLTANQIRAIEPLIIEVPEHTNIVGSIN